MSALALLALALGQRPSDPTAPFEGVWCDTNGVLMFVGNGRIDYNIEDRYYSAMVQQVPDGSLLGRFGAGRQIEFKLDGRALPKTSTDPLQWGSLSHLAPLASGLANAASSGEIRLTSGTRNASGMPLVAYLDSKATTSNGYRYTLVKMMGFDSFSLAGKYGDKDLSIEIQDPTGRTSDIQGTLSYLGAKRVFHGRRIMGRAGFVTFVDSRFGVNGGGYIVWSPSRDLIPKIRDRQATETDRITVHLDLANGDTAAGVNKVLPRIR